MALGCGTKSALRCLDCLVFTGILAAFDRLNERHPWSHNDAFAGAVLRQAKRAVKDGGRTALDVGCGTGRLLGRLCPLFGEVVGIEEDPATAALAAAALRQCPTVTVTRASFPADSRSYDFVSMVAVLHHLPLLDGIAAAREAVAPGGRLVIVGVYREEGRDALLSLVSLLLNPIVGILRHPRRASVIPASMTAPTRPATHSYREIRRALQAGLPGVTVHRSLFWRYVAIWHNQR